MNQEKIMLLSKKYEREFSSNNYNGINSASVPYQLLHGTKNVLISAPHAVNHYRRGQVKRADMYTGTIAKIVQQFSNAFCIYSTRIHDEDPNYSIGGVYKSAIQQICQSYPIDFIIDLHGAGSTRPFQVDLGTIHGTSINIDRIQLIKQIFSKYNINDVRQDSHFPAAHAGTITSFASHTLHIQAVQLEIHRDFRNPEEQLHHFSSIIYSLVDVVNCIGKELKQ